MGNDGLQGCKIISSEGGVVIAQDEPSSVVWGMPGHVVRAGLADAVLFSRSYWTRYCDAYPSTTAVVFSSFFIS